MESSGSHQAMGAPWRGGGAVRGAAQHHRLLLGLLACSLCSFPARISSYLQEVFSPLSDFTCAVCELRHRGVLSAAAFFSQSPLRQIETSPFCRQRSFSALQQCELTLLERNRLNSGWSPKVAALRCPGGVRAACCWSAPRCQRAEVGAVLSTLLSIRKWETSQRRRDAFSEQNVDVKRPQGAGTRRGELCAMQGWAGAAGRCREGRSGRSRSGRSRRRCAAPHCWCPHSPTQPSRAQRMPSAPCRCCRSTTDTTSAFVLYNCTFYFTAVRTGLG